MYLLYKTLSLFEHLTNEENIGSGPITYDIVLSSGSSCNH
jgi:hypothetical protein